MKKQSRQGFTLVEIGISVSVIGLLAALGIPSFSMARARSVNAVKERNVRLVDNAIEVWAMDNFALDGTPIPENVTNYIRGGMSSLRVGSLQPNITNITSKVVGEEITVEDLY